LHHTQGSGEQLARSLGWLEQNLPSDFWVSQLTTDFRADPELRIPRGSERPIVTVTGKAREGTNSLATLYEQFVNELHTKLPKEGAFKERLTPNGSKFTLDFSLYAPPLETSSSATPANEPEKPEKNGKTDKSVKPSDPQPAKGH